METSLVIPMLPPTLNHYWGQRGNRRFLLPKGLQFREQTKLASVVQKTPKFYNSRVELQIFLYPDSKRSWDIDNRLKALLDALEHAEIFENDSQIDRLCVVRGDIKQHEMTVVFIKELA